MILLEQLERDPKELFDTVLLRKSKTNKAKLEFIKEIIFERFDEYSDKKYTLENIGHSPQCCKEIKDILKGCYTRNKEHEVGMVTSNIISMQTNSIQSKCPHCGLSEPDTIDHYLPKDVFPEFSILPINLVPMCGRCNNIKNTDWEINGYRNSIHFYFDSFIDKKFLYCKLEYKSKVDIKPIAKFYLQKHEEMNDIEFMIAKNHFDTFNLYERYSKQIVEVISSTYEECVESGLGADINKKTIGASIRTKIRRNGVNYWEVCVLEAILKSDEFWNNLIDYL
ncbi:MAG: HNH endonuclease [Romboutsia sp.]|uniref:HNH endonuclease n=1 Tax=Romboutsia sp. TaxID=1965302 RepID=UPI003F2BD76E